MSQPDSWTNERRTRGEAARTTSWKNPEQAQKSYKYDKRWTMQGFKVEGATFPHGDRSLSDQSYSKLAPLNWKGSHSCMEPKDFLRWCAEIGVTEDLSAKGLTNLILDNVDPSLKRMIQAHLFDSLMPSEKETKILHVADFILGMLGPQEAPSEAALQKFTQAQPLDQILPLHLERNHRENESPQESGPADGKRYEAFFEAGLSLAYSLKWESYWRHCTRQPPSTTIPAHPEEWEEDHHHEECATLPSGIHTSNELKLRENLRARLEGKEMPHWDIEDISLASQHDVDLRYETLIPKGFREYAPPAKKAKKVKDYPAKKVESPDRRPEPKQWDKKDAHRGPAREARTTWDKPPRQGGAAEQAGWNHPPRQGKSEMKCFTCGEPGHLRPECPRRKDAEAPPRKGEGTCFTCGQPGHWKSECPQKNSRDRALTNWVQPLRERDDQSDESHEEDPVMYWTSAQLVLVQTSPEATGANESVDHSLAPQPPRRELTGLESPPKPQSKRLSQHGVRRTWSVQGPGAKDLERPQPGAPRT